MTFLELVQRLCVEADLGAGPTTTIGQVSDYAKAVNWIQAAYLEIQGLHERWNFLLKSFAFSSADITATTPTGMPAEISFQDTVITTLPTDIGAFKEDSFRCFLTATGSSDEQDLIWMDWDDFNYSWYKASSRNLTGRPTYITEKPSLELRLYPYPDAAYTVIGEYYREPEAFSGDTDTPIFKQHHMAIVWKALMFYGANMSEPDKYAFGESQYNKLVRKLEITQRPKMKFGRPLV